VSERVRRIRIRIIAKPDQDTAQSERRIRKRIRMCIKSQKADSGFGDRFASNLNSGAMEAQNRASEGLYAHYGAVLAQNGAVEGLYASGRKFASL
jgi:hypothetical protein